MRWDIVLNRESERHIDSGFLAYRSVEIAIEMLAKIMVRIANDGDDCRWMLGRKTPDFDVFRVKR